MKSLRALVVPPALALLVLADKDDGWMVLFNGQDLTGWKRKSSPAAAPSMAKSALTWKLARSPPES